jgi:hypothetical protein
MIYTAEVTIPANTAETDPVNQVMNVAKGLVYRVDLFFPPGPAGLAKICILDGGFQVWPQTVGNYLCGDSETIAFDDLYLKDQPPYVFTVRGFNLDDTYGHTVYIKLGLVSEEAFKARFLPDVAYGMYAAMLKKISLEQEVAIAEQLKSGFSFLQSKG